jgi:hypothetical protein
MMTKLEEIIAAIASQVGGRTNASTMAGTPSRHERDIHDDSSWFAPLTSAISNLSGNLAIDAENNVVPDSLSNVISTDRITTPPRPPHVIPSQPSIADELIAMFIL